MREGVVHLCVGGKLFATCADTLLKARGMKKNTGGSRGEPTGSSCESKSAEKKKQ